MRDVRNTTIAILVWVPAGALIWSVAVGAVLVLGGWI